jgi:hypothetical protein
MMMKRILLLVVVAACCVTGAKAQMGGAAAGAGATVSPAESFNALLTTTENQMMALVKEMPADKYGFAPSAAIFVPGQKTEYAGVRTFGALVIHVAQANYGMAARFGGIRPDVDIASLAGLKDKDQIVAALAASFAFVHKAIGAMTAENAFQSVGGVTTRASGAAGNVAHTGDEYGQMVEYARMNGIVPPPTPPPAAR